MKRLFNRMRRGFGDLKFWVEKKLGRYELPASLRNSNMDHGFKSAQASTRLREKWPELPGLSMVARERIGKSGKIEMYDWLFEQVQFHRINWMADFTPEKTNAALVVLELTLAGVEIPKDKRHLLDLTSDEMEGIAAMAKNLPPGSRSK